MTQPETHAQYLREARNILAAADPAPPQLAVVSSFSAEFLDPYLVVETNRWQCLMKPWHGPFNQAEQTILDEGSPLWQAGPAALCILLRLLDAHRHIFDEFPGYPPGDAERIVDEQVNRLVELAEIARTRFSGPILVANLTITDCPHQDSFSAGDPESLPSVLSRANLQLARALRGISDAYVFDYAGCVASCGGASWQDDRLWYMARLPLAPTAQRYAARALARMLAALLRPARKVIVVDLDNTLWGGVLGDDGIEGIQLGDEHPGNVYKDFQAALLGYRQRGYLLAVASKNDETLVREALQTHPEMLLRLQHFSAVEANWEAKEHSLRRIAQRLNVGLDSLVFVDDNPLECAHIRALLPMVAVVELPADPLGFRRSLAEQVILDRPRLVEEDVRRAAMYRDNAKRDELRSQAPTVDEFLNGLQMVAEVGQLDQRTLDRVHQLVQKTNQFNLTTRRHGKEEIRKLAASADARVAWLRLRDRFGDMGLVCVGIALRVASETWEIDTFLMSCRVMGRRVEDAFLHYLEELAQEAGAATVRGIYRPTPKNAPVADFYKARGFRLVEQGVAASVYERALNGATPSWPSFIQRIERSVEEARAGIS